MSGGRAAPAVAAAVAAAAALAACQPDGDAGAEPPPPEVPEIAPAWAALAGGDGLQEPVALATAPDGRFAVVGLFASRFTFGGRSFEGDGSVNGFLLMFASDGTPAWSRVIAGPGEDLFTSVRFVSDARGDALVVGGYAAPGATVADASVAADGQVNALVARFSTAGELQWLRPFPGTGFARVSHLAATPAGGLLASGDFSGSLTLDRALVAAGETDGFVAELTAAGDVSWSEPVATAGTETLGPVAPGPDGLVLVSGVTDGLPVAVDALGGAAPPGTVAQQTFVMGLRPGTGAAWRSADVFFGTHTHLAGQHEGIVLEQPELLSVGASGEVVAGATRTELFGPHGSGSLDVPGLGAAVVAGMDAAGTTLWRTEILGHDSTIRLAASPTGLGARRLVASFFGFIQVGADYLRSDHGERLFVSDVDARGVPVTRTIGLGAAARARAGGPPAAVAARGWDLAADGSTLVAATATFADGDRDVLLLRVP